MKKEILKYFVLKEEYLKKYGCIIQHLSNNFWTIYPYLRKKSFDHIYKVDLNLLYNDLIENYFELTNEDLLFKFFEDKKSLHYVYMIFGALEFLNKEMKSKGTYFVVGKFEKVNDKKIFVKFRRFSDMKKIKSEIKVIENEF